MALRQIKMSKVFTDIKLRWPSLINNDNESLINKESFSGMEDDVTSRIPQVNSTMCYLWNVGRLASQLIK